MDSVKKRLILPLTIFVSIMVMNISSIISGVKEHQTWRVIIASVSSVLMLGAVIIIFIRLSKAKKQETSGNE